MVYIIMPLRRTGNSVSPVEPGIEPLGRIRCSHLRRKHVTKLFVEIFCVGFGIEIIILPSPVSPASGEPAENLLCVVFKSAALIASHLFKPFVVRLGTLQP